MIFNIHSIQFWSCQDGQLLNHTVPVQASLRQFPSLLPVTDNCLFLNQQKRIFFPQKNVLNAIVDIRTAAYEAERLSTELPRTVDIVIQAGIYLTQDCMAEKHSFSQN